MTKVVLKIKTIIVNFFSSGDLYTESLFKSSTFLIGFSMLKTWCVVKNVYPRMEREFLVCLRIQWTLASFIFCPSTAITYLMCNKSTINISRWQWKNLTEQKGQWRTFVSLERSFLQTIFFYCLSTDICEGRYLPLVSFRNFFFKQTY